MKITHKGYPLKFIQTHPVPSYDTTCHIKTYVFKFRSKKTKFHYIVRAELHELDFFAIKFYAKRHRKSDRKYQIVVNKGDVAGVVVTAAKVIPYLLRLFPKASFGFFGSRTFDTRSNRLEPLQNNQRFKLYSEHI